MGNTMTTALDTPTLESEMDAESRRRFEELTLPYLGSLFRFAMKLTGEHARAEDLVQDTYVRALEAFPTLRDPARTKAWLFQILSRLAIDRRRSARSEVPISSLEEIDRFSLYELIVDEDPLPYSDRLHDDFLALFGDDAVRSALNTLSESYRVPLLLLHVEELSYREIADALECPVGTVMSRIHRGRKILEKELWEYAKRNGLVKTWKTES
jgi:RNA polymerase sigma-70 factor (ECF subfamily)